VCKGQNTFIFNLDQGCATRGFWWNFMRPCACN